MENSYLIVSRRQTVEPEFAAGVGESRDVRALHHHFGARQIARIEAVEDYSGDASLSRFCRRCRRRLRLLLPRHGSYRNGRSQGNQSKEAYHA